MNPRRNGLFAIFVSALLLLSAVVLVVNGNASTANPPSVPTVPSAPIAGPSLPSFSSLSNPSTTESALVQAFAAEHTPAAEQALFDGLSPSLVAALARLDGPQRERVEGASHSRRWHVRHGRGPVYRRHLGNRPCGVRHRSGRDVGSCVPRGRPRGPRRLRVGIAYGSIGQRANRQAGRALARNLADEFVTELRLAALGMENQLSASMPPSNALGYEGAAAALSQLGNDTFNEPLNLAQSGIAGEMAGVLAAQMATVANLEGQAIAITSSELGSANSEGQYCTLSIGGIETLRPQLSSCPTTSVSFTYPTGTASFGMALNWAQNNVDEFLNASETMTIWGGGVAGTVEFIPLDGSHPYINMTAAANPAIVNFTGPTGAYQIVLNLASENNILWPSIAAPALGGRAALGRSREYGARLGRERLGDYGRSHHVVSTHCGAESVSYLCGTTTATRRPRWAPTRPRAILFNLELAAETQRDLSRSAPTWATRTRTKCRLNAASSFRPRNPPRSHRPNSPR